MKIGITSDHRGFKNKEILKEFLIKIGYDVIDYGTDSEMPADFPDYAFKLGDAIASKKVDLGIAICGTGIGMSIALNKVKGVYCAKVNNVSEVLLSKSHNNANAIALSEELDEFTLKDIVVNFLNTPFSNIKKYINRNNKIKERENV